MLGAIFVQRGCGRGNQSASTTSRLRPNRSHCSPHLHGRRLYRGEQLDILTELLRKTLACRIQQASDGALDFVILAFASVAEDDVAVLVNNVLAGQYWLRQAFQVAESLSCATG